MTVYTRIGRLVGLLGLPLVLQGQSVRSSLVPLSLDKLSAQSAQWRPAGQVFMTPTDAKVSTKSGNNVLVGTPGQPLNLITQAPDVQLAFDLMLSPGAEAVLTVGGFPIRLTAAIPQQNGTIQTPTALIPKASSSKAPGLWQRVEVAVEGSARPARLVKLLLNGLLVQENVLMPPALRPATLETATLAVKNGTAAIRNIGYQRISNRPVARLEHLRYKFYENKTETTSPDELKNLKLVKEDTTSALTYEVAYGLPRWHGIVYSGDLVVDKADLYTIAMQNGGFGSLDIDGKPVISNTKLDLGQMNTAQVQLSAGRHPFTLFFGRSWPRPGFGLFIAGPDTKFQALHPAASLPEPDPVGAIDVNATNEPVLIRSFIQLPGENFKRTHCLSVGMPSGVNYTIDLNQDALLQVWRGGFADVTEMWYERGEPQLLEPLGAPVRLSGQPAVALLSNPQQAWPDSLTDSELTYKGYNLDASGLPTIRYQYRGLALADAIRPDANGNAFSRTITMEGAPSAPAYCRVASSANIEEVGKGVYAVNDRSYYVQFDPKLKPVLRTINGKQELLLPFASKGASASINYLINW